MGSVPFDLQIKTSIFISSTEVTTVVGGRFFLHIIYLHIPIINSIVSCEFLNNEQHHMIEKQKSLCNK